MYGYVLVNKPELKFKEFDIYQSYYCGLCEALGERYGMKGRLTISYDMTFLVLLLNALYEPKEYCVNERCIVHPIGKHQKRRSFVSDYVADMNMLMTYYKCVDDWNDERKISQKMMAEIIRKNMRMLLAKYPQKCKRLQKQFKQLHTYEKNNCNDIDKVSSCFGTILGTLFAIKNDEWKECLEKIGFFLGKYIYILDAYDDMIEDIKENRYNVLKFYKNKENFNEFIETVLNTLMAQCARYFERLLIIKDVEILRNIIYSGVWVRYSSIKKRRSKGDKSI